MGLTRGQLRRMPATEAVLLTVVATLLGTVIGIGFAWAGCETIVKRALRDATMHIPWSSLGAVVLLRPCGTPRRCPQEPLPHS
ncbi:ABC transporter permease [Microbispora hainanensis]|uniref:ABC transporter permease n=1 Tax=Microbispora hainanensis TaxID=568844 RepID=A0ABZ1SQC9_9ACTN|nr:ABC transporter permease [Microbispora hainanensis]